jgi:hypothetical protein
MKEKKIITETSFITSAYKMDLKADDLIFIRLFENVRLEIPEIAEINENIKTLVNGNPFYLVVFPGHGSTLTDKARKFASKMRKKNIIAEAIVVNDLTSKSMAYFYKKTHLSKQKIKIFSNASSASGWINVLKKK